ncbi:MAG: hypothetical protein ACOYNZ_07320 [Rhodoferax sp.]
MSATIDRRISELQQFMERQERRRTGPKSFIDEVAAMLQGIDGQADLGMLPGEDLMDTMTRRMQSVDGYDLSGMPGASLMERRANVEPAYFGQITVSPAARHAARSYFRLFDYV